MEHCYQVAAVLKQKFKVKVSILAHGKGDHTSNDLITSNFQRSKIDP